MSNRRKATNPTSPLRDVPILALSGYSADILEKPGAEPLVALGLRGDDLAAGREQQAEFVMFPDAARDLIATLQQALDKL